MKRQLLIVIVLSSIVLLSLGAQDFGFGFDDEYETTTPGGYSPSVSISGEAAAELLGYFHDFSEELGSTTLGDIFSGKLNFYAGASFAEAFINLKLKPTLPSVESPVLLDEAFVRAYFRGFEIEGGLRKLTWGKADSFGPLDVINPLDYSQLTDFSNTMNFKIARPLVHLTYRFGSFSKIEGVFVPTFEPLRFAVEGRWFPAQLAQMDQMEQMGQMEQLSQYYQQKIMGLMLNGQSEQAAQVTQFLQSYQSPQISNIGERKIDTLKYAQAGLRFTTTVGPADVGVQYYYGRITRPAVKITTTTIPVLLDKLPTSVYFDYNPYHQIGVDFAQVLYGINARAELAANITSDLKGDDGAVYNPHLVWSLGFDRDLVYGINLNMQINESIRLMNGKINNNKLSELIPIPLDTEADTDMTATQLITVLSKTFFKGQLEVRTALFWELEAKDVLFIPSVVWTKDALSVGLSAGIFGGDKAGQFGQYRDNSFIKTVLKYSF